MPVCYCDQFLFYFCVQELDNIHEDVESMSTCCQDMTKRLKVSNLPAKYADCKAGFIQFERNRI